VSREIKLLIEQLEAERNEIYDFWQAVDAQVRSGELTPQIAQKILRAEYNGAHPQTLIELKNLHISEAREILAAQKREFEVRIAPVAVIMLLGVALVWNYAAITGLFTADDEAFYGLSLNQVYESSTVVVLPVTANMSSFRVDGEMQGTGRANIYLRSGENRFLVARFEEKQAASPLTGFFTLEDGTIIEENLTNNTTEVSPEPQIELEEVIEEPLETEAPAAVTEEPVTSEPVVEDTPVVELPSTPQREDTVEEPRVQTLDKECIETCNLPGITGPFQLEIEIRGKVVVTIGDIVYGERTTTPVDLPPQLENNTTVETPAVTASLGTLCSNNEDCASNACKSSIFNGDQTNTVCAPANAVCIAGTNAYEPSQIFGDSTCYENNGETAWITNAGNGRFEIKTANNEVVAVIDKYGNMAIKGSATFDTKPGKSGWVIRDAAGTEQLSIDNDGNLKAAGTLTENEEPQPTDGGDFIVQNTDGSVQAVITEEGDVILAGKLISEVNLS
jgi:hypothetical protein